MCSFKVKYFLLVREEMHVIGANTVLLKMIQCDSSLMNDLLLHLPTVLNLLFDSNATTSS